MFLYFLLLMSIAINYTCSITILLGFVHIYKQSKTNLDITVYTITTT